MTDTVDSRDKRPSLMKGLVFIALLAVITTGLILAALSRRSPTGPLVATGTPPPISVQTAEVAFEPSLRLEETFSGIVQPRRTSQLGFSSGGRVAQITVDVGDRVSSGQLLARLDTRDLQANLAAAEASIAEAQANYRLARTTVDRQQTLFERGHVAQQRVDEAEASANASAARIEAARAQADTLRVAIDLAAIRAPYSGTITRRMNDEGAIAAPGVTFLELVETGTLDARIGLPGATVAELEPGATYELISDRGPVKAKLRAETGVIDPGLRTVTAVFDILEPEAVSAGAVVRLALPRDVSERGFWVPVTALVEAQRGLWSLYVVEPIDDGWEVRPRLVEVVHSDADRVFVRGTVRDGEAYVSDGLRRLVPGQQVLPSGIASASRTNTSGGERP